MNKYYTDEARKSAIKEIDRLIEIVMTAPGDVIDYLSAGRIVEILAQRKSEIASEIQN